ncbi:MAG: TolC family protein [Phocaeicola sp.]
MMKKIIIPLFSLFVCFQSFAQLTLESCYKKAEENYPLIKQYDLITQSREYNLANAQKGFLPQVALSAKATYQSQVIEVPIASIKPIKKDQYGVQLEIMQSIWDGGVIRSKKEGITSSAEAEARSVDVTIYAIRERINELFFGLLLCDAQIEQNGVLQAELARNNRLITAYIVGGVANETDLDAVKVEELKAKQNLAQLENTRRAYAEMLSLFIGEELPNHQAIRKPSIESILVEEIHRPELQMFQAQIESLHAKESQINAELIPKLSLFVNGGYGRPGLNMLDTEFRPYYLAGVRLVWNIGGFYTAKNSKRLIENSIGSVNNQQKLFLFTTRLEISKGKNQIEAYREQMKYDDEIIELKESIKRASEVKMAHGTLSGSDLVRNIHSEQLAKQEKIIHEIELLLALYNLKFTTNN